VMKKENSVAKKKKKGEMRLQIHKTAQRSKKKGVGNGRAFHGKEKEDTGIDHAEASSL